MCCGKVIAHNVNKEIVLNDKQSVSAKPKQPAKKKNYNSVKPKFGYTN